MYLGILTSHPIQYQAPWFQALADAVDLEVFFAHRVSAVEQGKAGFGVAFEWDVDLLSGYKSRFLQNVARKPGVNHFFGCDTPEIASLIARQQDYETTEPQRRFDAFIVTGWNLMSYWQAIRACRKASIPILVRGDSQLGTTRSLLKRAVKELTHRLALRQFDRFLSVGQRNREYLLHYGVPPKKIFFAPHFVDNERFRENAKKLKPRKAEIRKQWKIPEDAFCVLFCGKFIGKKRPLDLVKAARLLLRSDPELKVHLLFVGSGALGAEIRASCNVVFDADNSNSSPATRHSPLPNASFAGFLNQTEIARAYVAADVLVLPSDGKETWGLVVNEGMACGLPAIVSDAVGCAPDLIDRSGTGFTHRFGKAADLTQQLKGLFEMKKQKHNFRAALADKMQIYSLESAVSGTLRATESLVRAEM